MIETLTKAYKHCSKEVYQLMRVINDQRINIDIAQVREEGITSALLKRLVEKAGDLHVEVKSLKVNEHITGMDIDLWIGENNKKYLRFCIQAKSFGNNTSPEDKYEKICYNQCQKLINYSKKKNGNNENQHEAIPLYFLYQHLVESKNYLKKKFFWFLDNSFRREYTGVTFTHAENIQRLLDRAGIGKNQKGNIAFDAIHENSFFHNPFNNQNWRGTLMNTNLRTGAFPLYCLAKFIPSKINALRKLNNPSSGPILLLLLLLLLGDEWNIHDISSEQINKLYGNNDIDIPSENLKTSFLVIINDKYAEQKKIMKEIDESL